MPDGMAPVVSRPANDPFRPPAARPPSRSGLESPGAILGRQVARLQIGVERILTGSARPAVGLFVALVGVVALVVAVRSNSDVVRHGPLGAPRASQADGQDAAPAIVPVLTPKATAPSADRNPFALHLRTAFNNYLAGIPDGIDLSAVEPSISDGTHYGLASFPRDLYKSRFLVVAFGASIAGGADLAVVFRSDMDRAFTAWVYNADTKYELRGFWENEALTRELPRIRSQLMSDFADQGHGF